MSQCERRSSGDLNIDIEVIDIEVDTPNLVAIQGIGTWCPPLNGQLQSTYRMGKYNF